jgi:hypothetical protein
MEWNDPFFRKCFDNSGKLVTWISRKQPLKTFVRLQMIGHLINDKKISCGTTMLKSVEERCLCQDIQRRNGSCITGKKVYKSLGKDELFLVCLRKQSVLRPGTHTCTHHCVIFLCTC